VRCERDGGRPVIAHEHRPKKRAASIHLYPDVRDRVTQMAQAERRPISQLLRNIVADAVAAQARSAFGERVAA
jgi:predicted transcriptional regulator